MPKYMVPRVLLLQSKPPRMKPVSPLSTTQELQREHEYLAGVVELLSVVAVNEVVRINEVLEEHTKELEDGTSNKVTTVVVIVEAEEAVDLDIAMISPKEIGMLLFK